MWDEVEAAVDLDQQFWAELQSAKPKFLWLPKVNYLTGRWMWLCNAVCAVSGHTIEFSDGAELELTTTRWYKPKDFVVEHLTKS